ncbi:MAG: flagellar biosynthetic protein FliR [Phycisphaerales bacterium]
MMQLPSPPVLALGLAACRVAGVCLLAPVVASPVVPRRVALALAILLGAAALPGALDAHTQHLPTTVGGAVGCAALECALGAAMGLMALLPVAALRTAGSLCGVQMGLGFGSLYDSSQADEPGAWDGIEQLLGMAALAVFVWAGGLESLALGVLRSFDYVPVASALGLSGMAAMLTRGLLACSELALRVALPVTAVLMAETLVTGVLSRAMPALGPVQFGFPARVGIGLLALAAGAAATQDALHGASGAALDALHTWMTGGAA